MGCAISCLLPREAKARKQRFVGALALSKVHRVRPELVAEITYLSWEAISGISAFQEDARPPVQASSAKVKANREPG